MPDSITLQCNKTGREYEVEVPDDGTEVVDLACPYCQNRGLGPVADDIRQNVERIRRLDGTEGEDA